jgi:hypothetical protein
MYSGNIKIKVEESTYLKDPEGSELGQRIVEESIRQIDVNGLEAFNFKKLAEAISTTEASVYRYFENKNKLLLYLTSWYWAWLEYQIVLATVNIENAERKLFNALGVIIKPQLEQNTTTYIDLKALRRIAVSESSKSYFTKNVDDLNRNKLYSHYKSLNARIAQIIKEVDVSFPYPNSLSSTILEGILHQPYYYEHLPSLNDIGKDTVQLHTFFYTLCLGTIKAYREI